MSRSLRHTAASKRHDGLRRDAVRRAFREFLAFPSLVIAAFLALAVVTNAFDRNAEEQHDSIRSLLEMHVFSDAGATADLLGTIAGAVITVTSITISLLLVAVQQSASTMTTQVFDQFLRRRHNQLYFGFFVGLSLYALVTLATVNDPFNPVYGGSTALLLSAVALYLLIVLLYTTINQMRPAEIVEAIHDHTLTARERYTRLSRRTRSIATLTGTRSVSVHSQRHGYVTRIDVEAIGTAAQNAGHDLEVILLVPIGGYVAYGDRVAVVRVSGLRDVADLASVIQRSIRLERQRDVDCDPQYGIQQLEMIAWTSISTSKSNPLPGLLGIRALRDLLARWGAAAVEQESEPQPAGAADEETSLPVVYTDNVPGSIFDTLESLGVAASESLQHQSVSEVFRALALTYSRIPVAWRPRADAAVLRLLSSLGEHVLTAELDTALTELANELRSADGNATADALADAHAALRRSVGKLGSRSTRASEPTAGAGSQ